MMRAVRAFAIIVIGVTLIMPANRAARAQARAEAVALYVAANGNDSWSGKKPAPNESRSDGPFASLERARDAIRALKRRHGGLERPVIVYLRAGTYFLRAPFVLGPEDSGTRACPVTYAAYPGEKPVLSGGQRITAWKSARVNGKKAWAAALPAVKKGEWHFHQLFVNDERRPRTRLPKEGFFRVAGLMEAPADAPFHQGQDRFEFAGEDLKQWKNPGDADIVALTLWIETRMPLASVDPAARIATLAKKSTFHLKDDFGKGGARYYVENVFEALDSPGQWYLDRPTGTLYYLPKNGEDPKRCRVIAPRLEQVLRFEGDAAKKQWVEYVRLDGLTFSHTEWNLPPESAGASQAAASVPGAVYWQGARQCMLRNCTVAHIGNYAVELAGGSERNTIAQNVMADLGAGGVKVGHGCKYATVRDNDIGDGGHIYHSAVGVWIGNSGHNAVLHNHIHDLYYTGVSVGWTWGYGPSDAVANRIEYNHIHHVGRGLLSDLGGIYTLGVSPGTVLRGNLIHDCQSYSYGGWGIYHDEGSSHIVDEDNLVYRTKTGGFHQHYGRENILQNNIFAFAKEGQIIRSREEDHISFYFRRNIVYFSDGPLLGSTWKNGNFRLDSNLYFNTGGKPLDFAGRTLEQWQAAGQDAHSLVADPKFKDPEHDDFTLAPDSRALKIGFKPFDPSRAGPRR